MCVHHNSIHSMARTVVGLNYNASVYTSGNPDIFEPTDLYDPVKAFPQPGFLHRQGVRIGCVRSSST